MRRRPRPLGYVLVVLAAVLLSASCGLGDNGDVHVAPVADPAASAVSSTTVSSTTVPATTATSTTTTSASPSSTTSSSSTTTTTTTTTAPDGAAYTEQEHTLFSTTGDVELFHPARLVELIGFHEAGHDGSQQQAAAGGSAPTVILETRSRNTGSRTAADIVVHPDAEIRSPVTGTVIRGGTYVLYCDHSDNFLVIEPDAAPGWEVKIFHIDGLEVEVGDHLDAGVTVIAPRATRLPFESQVDEFTAEPSNPHVHIEVVDPSIPDIPSPGGGC